MTTSRIRLATLVVPLAIALAGLAGCGDDGATNDTSAGAARGADPATDKLAQVRARGTLILFTDPAYPPQSFKAKRADRPANTKCAANEMTAPEIAGYDADTGKLVADALAVEPCFVTPSWTEVTAGNWGDRWDLAYGSGAIEFSRMDDLYMTQPYYSTPANFFVPRSSPAQSPSDLSGKRVGACTGCTMEKYLRGTLRLPGPKLEQLVSEPRIVTFDTEVPGLAATAARKVDAFLCSEPVGAEGCTPTARSRACRSSTSARTTPARRRSSTSPRSGRPCIDQPRRTQPAAQPHVAARADLPRAVAGHGRGRRRGLLPARAGLARDVRVRPAQGG
jgi:polar amino acid transport system substrate-binding protein